MHTRRILLQMMMAMMCDAIRQRKNVAPRARPPSNDGFARWAHCVHRIVCLLVSLIPAPNHEFPWSTTIWIGGEWFKGLGRFAASLVEIFTNHAHLDINKTLVPIYGETLLQQAVTDEKVEYVKALLQLAADPATKNAMDRSTPLESLLMPDQEEYEGRNETQEEFWNCWNKPWDRTISELSQRLTRSIFWEICTRILNWN